MVGCVFFLLFFLLIGHDVSVSFGVAGSENVKSIAYPPSCSSSSCSSHGECVDVQYNPSLNGLILVNDSSSSIPLSLYSARALALSSLDFRHLDVSGVSSVCLCDSDWTGDDLYRVYNDCHLPIAPQKPLNILAILSEGIAAVHVLYILFRTFLSYNSSVSLDVPLFRPKLLVFLGGFIFLFGVCAAEICLMTISSYSNALFSVCILSAFASGAMVPCVWLCCYLFLISLPQDVKHSSIIQRILRDDASKRQVLHIVYILGSINGLLCFCAFVLPFAFVNQSDYKFFYHPWLLIIIVLVLAEGTVLLLVAVFMIFNIRRLELLLSDQSFTSKTRMLAFYSELKRRFLFVIFFLSFPCFFAGIAFLIAISSDYFIARQSMIWPLNIFAGGIFFFGLSLVFRKALQVKGYTVPLPVQTTAISPMTAAMRQKQKNEQISEHHLTVEKNEAEERNGEIGR